jgi:sulfur-carrier protein
MTIEVKLFATLRMHLGVASVSLEVDSSPTVEQLIEMVSAEVGEDIHDWLLEADESLRMGTMILLDGHNIIHINGLETKVDTTQVAIFPPAGGG